MQPFQAIVRPRSASTIGWAPASVRSMIFRRRCPRATRPCDQAPAPSGPLGAMTAAMADTAATSGTRPSSRTSPVAPHIVSTLPAAAGKGDVRAAAVLQPPPATGLYRALADRQDGPAVRHAFQEVTAAVVEREPGSQHEWRDGAGYQDLIGLCDSHDPRRDVHRDAVHVAILDLDLARVQSGANMQP